MRVYVRICQCQILSVESGAGFLDSAHGLDNVLVACGIAHTEAFGTAKSIAAYGCHVRFLKQIKGKVGGGPDGTLAIGLAEIA